MRVNLSLVFLGAVAATGCTGTGALPQVEDPLAVEVPDQNALDEFLTPDQPAGAEERAAARAQRDQRSADLETIYENNKAETVRAGALYDLAGLQQERAFDLLDQANAAQAVEADRFAIGELSSEPTPKLEAYKDALLKRVNLLREMASTFPRDPRHGEVLWQLASAMARLGNSHCENYFEDAAHQAKSPDLTNKVKLSLADWRATNGKWDAAIKLYAEVRDSIKDSADPLKGYATYRLGWAYLGALDKKKAGAALELAFLSVQEDPPNRLRVKAAAAHELAALWAEVGRESEAQAFAAAHGLPAFMDEYHAHEADKWLRQGQYPKVIAYCRDQIAKSPTDARAADLRLRIAHAQVAIGDLAGMQAEVSALGKMASDPADPWFEEHQDNQALLERTKKIVNLLPLASGFKVFNVALVEKDAKKKKSLMTAAVKTLQDQQKTVTDPEQSLALRMTLIQGYIALERYPEALDQLDGVVKLGQKAGPHLVDAAYARLEILVKLDGEQKYPALPAPGEVKTPLPLPPLKQRFAAAAADYLALVPAADNKVNLQFQVAQDLFSYGHYAKALPLLEAVAVEFPRTDQGKASIEYCLSMNLKEKNYPELIRLSTAFLNNREVKGKALRDYIKQNLDWGKQQAGVGASATAH